MNAVNAPLIDTNLLGQGGNGKVYTLSDSKHVVKIAASTYGEGIDLGIVKELACMTSLKDKENILKVEKFRKSDDGLLLKKYDYDLHYYIRTYEVDERDAKIIVYKLLTAMYDAESRGIMHRDIKPSNILIKDNSEIVLADFGLSSFTNADFPPYNKELVQTVTYRSPEIFLGSRSYTSKIDVWSAGVVFSDILLNRPCGLFHSFEDDDTMLYNIFQVMGFPTNRRWKNVHKLPYYETFIKKHPSNTINNTLKSRFSHCSKGAVDLLSKMLTLDPSKRISIVDALNHYFFDQSPTPPINLEVSIKELYLPIHCETHYVNEGKRCLLLSWVMENAIQLKLHHQTFFLTCLYIDKYLEGRRIDSNTIQLLGMTAVLIASKVNEYRCLNIETVRHLCKYKFTESQVKLLERELLESIELNAYRATEYHFYQFAKQNLKWNDETSKLMLHRLYKVVLNRECRNYKPWEIIPKIISNDTFDATDVFMKAYTSYKGHEKIWKYIKSL